MPALYEYKESFRILSIEDNPDDAFLILHTLKANFPKVECTQVSGKAELLELISGDYHPEIILSDWSLPQFNGLAALETVRAKGIDVPFIIVSGKIGEETAIAAIRQGVYDYVLKDNLGRLPTAIHHALEYYENEKKAKIHNALITLQATALRVAPAAIAVFDPSGSVEWINPAFEELTGYSSNDLLGLDIRSACAAARNLRLELMDRGPEMNMERMFTGIDRKKDGSLYFEESRFCPVIDQEGKLTHIVAIRKDVTSTEQQKKELELDLLLAMVLAQAKSPEGLCLSALSFLKEQFPGSRQNICLFTDGRSNDEKWFGEKSDSLMPSGHGKPVNRENPSQPSVEHRSYQHIMKMDEEKIAQLQIVYPMTSAFDQEKLFDALAGQIDVALQRMIAQQRFSAQIRNVSFLKLISRTINVEMDFETVGGPLLRKIQEILDCDAIALFLNDKETDELRCRAQSGFRTGIVNHVSIPLGQPYVGIAAEEQRIVSISDFSDLDSKSSLLALVKAENFVSQSCAPIIIAGKVIGVLEVFQRKAISLNSEWFILFDAIATQTGLALDYNSINADLQQAYLDLELSYEATIEGWSAAMDYRDQETEGHSKRVTSLTLSLSARLGVSEDEITAIRRGALLHDIGKIGIPDSILKKPGPLDEKEWELMKKHPLIAYELLSKIPYLKQSLDIPLYHHEKWDGSGYPYGLKGEKIPFSARLFSIIDVFDALTSDRPYRQAWNKTETLRYIQEQAGAQFDPAIVKIFIPMIEG